MTKYEKAKEVIKANWRELDSGIFNTRNIVGDTMDTIYDDGDLVIDACWGWAYFEVFGLSEAEFDALKAYYNYLRKEDEVEPT